MEAEAAPRAPSVEGPSLIPVLNPRRSAFPRRPLRMGRRPLIRAAYAPRDRPRPVTDGAGGLPVLGLSYSLR